jgi:hypothetical protein
MTALTHSPRLARPRTTRPVAVADAEQRAAGSSVSRLRAELPAIALTSAAAALAAAGTAAWMAQAIHIF